MGAEKSFAGDDNDLETVKRIDNWFSFFEESLKQIFDDKNLVLEFDRKNYYFYLSTANREKFDFNTLADGYSSILKIVNELVLRMEKVKTGKYDVQGIVLIDEIETHLHIDLQKKILPFLTSIFPEIQFIVTTHSPFVITSEANAVIYDLENRILVEDLSGYSYDGIIESYFDNDKYSGHIKKKIATYEELVRKPQLTDAEETELIELRLYLEQIPADLAPELASQFLALELQRKGR